MGIRDELKSEGPNQREPTIDPTDPSNAGPGATSEAVRDGSSTPQWLFDVLNRQVEDITGHGFQLDAAASEWNAKCGNYYDEEDDALVQDWSGFLSIWCNPPFKVDLIRRFVAKAVEAAEKGSTVVLLLPSWPGYDWY